MDIKICKGRTCKAKFSEYIKIRLDSDIEKFEVSDVKTIFTPCMGGCSKGPNIKIDAQKIEGVTPTKASELLFKKI